MANRIGQSQKLVKQNRKVPDSTTNPSNASSTTSNIRKKLNENTDIISKESLTDERDSSTNSAAHNSLLILFKLNLYPSHTQKHDDYKYLCW